MKDDSDTRLASAEARTEQAETRTEEAGRRTDWAEDRTMLANERTFSGWLRTALGGVAVALGLQALFGKVEPTWLPRAVASAFIALAVLVVWTAERRAARTRRQLDSHATRVQGRTRMRIIAGLFTVAALATGGLLWLL